MSLPQFHVPNLDAQRQAIAASQGSANFKFEKNSLTYLYLLPPWSEKGSYVRMTKECFLGDMGHWTCLHTYECYQAGISRQDEVVSALFDCWSARGKPDNIRRMLPQTRWYANCLIDGVLKYNPDNTTQPYAAVAIPQQVTIPFSHGLWDKILKELSDPRVGFASEPTSAVCIVVKREDPVSGPTTYSVELAGKKDEREGVYELDRKNLAERWPGEELVAIYNNINDLDARWPMPEESVFVECAKLAQAIKTKFLSATAGEAAGAAAPGFSPPPGAGTQFGGSAAPAAPGLAVGTPPGAPGVAGPGVPGGPTAAPGVAAPGVPAAAPPGALQPTVPGSQAPGTTQAFSLPGQAPGAVPPGNVPAAQVPGT